MPDIPLPTHPFFRLQPAAAAGVSRTVLTTDDEVIGQVDAGGGFRGRVGRDAGPVRPTAPAAADDVATLHIAFHGMPADELRPYSCAAEAGAALVQVFMRREGIVNSSARAYHFHAPRQPHVAAVLNGLEAIAREDAAAGTRSGCRRIARLLDLVLSPARALLSEADGDAREWMAFPMARVAAFAEQARTRLLATAEQPPADLQGPFPTPYAADQLVDAVHRTWRDLEAATSHTLTESALDPLRAAASQLPTGPCARRSEHCTSAAAALRAVADQAQLIREAGTVETQQVLAQELAALGTDGAERLEATARLLKDTSRLGRVVEIHRDVAHAELGTEGDVGHRSVRVDGHEAGPIAQAPAGGWTGSGITAPYHSPEGATAALVRAHRARQTAADSTTPTRH